jgi:adenosylcobinamide-GDP ribazoletransferase
LFAELAAAFTLLTRLPTGWMRQPHSGTTFAQAIWAYPLVGAVVGAIAAAIYGAAVGVGLPAAFAAVCALGASAMVTGALHEDALADMADGFGGRTKERKLEIMRDSRLGSFGVLALVLSSIARWSAIAAISTPGRAASAIVVAAVVGRGAMLVPLLTLPPARSDGLASGLRNLSKPRAAIGLAFSFAIAFVLLCPVAALGAIVGAMLAACCVSALAWRHIGGQTGDVLGATEVAVECVVLGTLALSRLNIPPG